MLSLYTKIETLFISKYNGADKQLYLNLCKIILFNEPVNNAIIKGKLSNWDNLPKDKSLFAAKPDYGLPIGNLTSQVFANVYMSCFDYFIRGLGTSILKHPMPGVRFGAAFWGWLGESVGLT